MTQGCSATACKVIRRFGSVVQACQLSIAKLDKNTDKTKYFVLQ